LLVKIACEALGRMGIAERARDALGRHLARETDELRAIQAGIALCRLGGPEAEKHVLAGRHRFPGLFWEQVTPFLDKASTTALPAFTAEEYNERGLTRSAKGDLEGAI